MEQLRKLILIENCIFQCIIPIFTKNLREAFRTVSWGRRIWLRLYAVTRFPLVPIYGGFPVKLKTFVGKPIPYDGSLTPEQLQIKVNTAEYSNNIFKFLCLIFMLLQVASALEDLIKEHQIIPGSITRALLERIFDLTSTKKL